MARGQDDGSTFDRQGISGYNRYDLAGVTQLVEFLPSKQVVAGSSPVSRSTKLSNNLPS